MTFAMKPQINAKWNTVRNKLQNYLHDMFRKRSFQFQTIRSGSYSTCLNKFLLIELHKNSNLHVFHRAITKSNSTLTNSF